MKTLEKIKNLQSELRLLANQELDSLETMDLLPDTENEEEMFDHLWDLPIVYDTYQNMKVPHYLAKVINDEKGLRFIGWEVEDRRIESEFYRHDLDMETTIELLETVEYIKNFKNQTK